MSKNELIATIQNAQPLEIANLEFVKEKFIENYNKCNNSTNGEMMYHNQVIHFNQQIASSDQLKKADKFSLYACFVVAAANGYSLDPSDEEVYLWPIDGKARLSKQAGAYVRRLMKTNQIKFAEQAKLVYKGDVLEVAGGRVQKHIEKFESDDIIAGYIRFVLDDKGNDKYFIYRRSDWEAWRKKSANSASKEKSGQYGKYVAESLWDNGVIGGTNPEPNFLRTKITKHAAKDKSWAVGNSPLFDTDGSFQNIEVDADEIPEEKPKMNIDSEYADFDEVDEHNVTHQEYSEEQEYQHHDDDEF